MLRNRTQSWRMERVATRRGDLTCEKRKRVRKRRRQREKERERRGNEGQNRARDAASSRVQNAGGSTWLESARHRTAVFWISSLLDRVRGRLWAKLFMRVDTRALLLGSNNSSPVSAYTFIVRKPLAPTHKKLFPPYAAIVKSIPGVARDHKKIDVLFTNSLWSGRLRVTKSYVLETSPCGNI